MPQIFHICGIFEDDKKNKKLKIKNRGVVPRLKDLGGGSPGVPSLREVKGR